MGRLLSILALAAGAMCANGFLVHPIMPSSAVSQSIGARSVAPLEMAKHAQFKIIKKKMHKRPKKSNPSDRNRRPSEHAVDKRDMSGPGWLFPEQEGWVAYDEATHGPLDDEIKERVEGLETIWVRIINPKTGEPVLSE